MFIFQFNFPDSSTSEHTNLHMWVYGVKINQALIFFCGLAPVFLPLYVLKRSFWSEQLLSLLHEINEFFLIARIPFAVIVWQVKTALLLGQI